MEMYRYSICLLKYVPVLLKNLVDLFMLSGDVLFYESTHYYSIFGMMRIYHNQCEFLSMVDKHLCLFGIYHSNH